MIIINLFHKQTEVQGGCHDLDTVSPPRVMCPKLCLEGGGIGRWRESMGRFLGLAGSSSLRRV